MVASGGVNAKNGEMVSHAGVALVVNIMVISAFRFRIDSLNLHIKKRLKLRSISSVSL